MAEITKKAITGADCVAEAMRQINPDVVAAYPITPQTPIMHAFEMYVADGEVDTIFIDVESEHSAMSACIGAAASGARTMTATSANGLAFMWEVVYIAAGYRLPIVMNLVNRALPSPINIHCDHSDAMGVRDSGWLMFFSENGEEAYENTLMAVRIGEHPDVRLPVMVNSDGFITSHGVEVANLLDDDSVKTFVGEYKIDNPLLDTDHPVTYGPLDLFDYFFEHKRQHIDAMEKSIDVIWDVFEVYGNLSGKKYDFFEGYMLDDAERVIFCASSTCGTIRYVVDELRKKGEKVGLLKMRVYRPFFHQKVVEKLKNAKAVAVLDRAAAPGAYGAFFNEIRSAFYESKKKPNMVNYIYGLGGREATPELIRKVFAELDDVKDGNTGELLRYLGLRE